MKIDGKFILFASFTLFGFLYFTINVDAFGLGNVVNNFGRAKKALKIGKAGMKAYSGISEEEQYYIGRSVGARLLANYKLSNSKKLSKYVSDIGQTLVMASERPETFKGYHFIVLDEPDKINAFSIPSGFIFVSTGLIKKAINEDELAGALAHEVAHIVYDHPTDSIKKVYKDQIKKDLVAFAAEEVAASQSSALLGSLVQGLNKVSGMLIDNAAKGYSREKENDADLMAAQIMTDTGYDPNALAGILKKLNPVGSGKSGTHGNPKKRAENITKFAKELKSHPKIAVVRTKRFKIAMKPGK